MKKLYKHIPRLGVLDIFNNAQKSRKSHGRLITNLFNLYQKSSNDFTIEFLQALCVCFCGEKGPYVELSLEFAASYFAYHAENINSEDDSFVLNVYEFLFKNCAGNQRLRICEFINKLLSAMGDEATIDDEIFQNLADSMLDRLQDKSAPIRAQAVMALRRLQEPHEKDCSIMKALKYHLEYDPNHEVRAKVLSLIAITQKTLPAILTRIHDKSDMVRKEFYKTVSRLKLNRFTLKKRQGIIEYGLRDRSEIVREFVKNTLVNTWFEQCNYNHAKFLACLDVETFGDSAKTLLFCIFKQQSTYDLIDMMRSQQIKDRKVVSIETINPELAVLWQCLVAYIRSLPESEIEDDDAQVTKVLPELTPFTNYIREFMSTSSHKPKQKLFILRQLLEISCSYCLSDEMGRMQLRNLCVEMLINDEIDTSVVPVLIKVLNRTMPCVKSRVATVAEIISDIRNPLQVSESHSKSDDDIKTADIGNDMEFIQNKMSELRPSKSEGFPEEEHETRNDSETLIKCLTILKETLQSPDLLKLDEVLLTIKDHFISQCIMDKNIQVLSLSVNVLDLMCLRSLSLAKEMFYKFFVLIYEGIIQIPPLQAVFNILANHGFEAFPLEIDFNMTAGQGDDVWPTFQDMMNDQSLPTLYIKHVVAQLSGFLESTEPEVKITTCQGFIKLFISGRLSSPIILSQLVLLWYSPSTELEPLIRQPLGLFFANCSLYCPNIAEVICKSVITVMKVLFKASSANPSFFAIDVESVVSMLISLVRDDTLQPQSNVSKSGASYHLMVAEMICDEIIDHHLSPNIIFVKVIPHIKIIPGDAKHASSLNEKLKKVIQICKRTNRKVQKPFEDLKENVEKIIANATEDRKNSESDADESPSMFSNDTNAKDVSSHQENGDGDVHSSKGEDVNNKIVISESDKDSSTSDCDIGPLGENTFDHKSKTNDDENIVPDSDPESDLEFHLADQIKTTKEFKARSNSPSNCPGSSVKPKKHCTKRIEDLFSTPSSSSTRELRSSKKIKKQLK